MINEPNLCRLIRIFTAHILDSQDITFLQGDNEDWSYCMDAQADLSLQEVHLITLQHKRVTMFIFTTSSGMVSKEDHLNDMLRRMATVSREGNCHNRFASLWKRSLYCLLCGKEVYSER